MFVWISGVFYIHASAPPQYLDDMCTVIGQELLKMATPSNTVSYKRIYFICKKIIWNQDKIKSYWIKKGRAGTS